MTKAQAIAIAGPTASGKSDLGLKLARELNGEIICMDSMQIYRHMDIGTAKPTPEEQSLIPHHMLDILEPTENYAVADYATAAEKVILDVASRGKVPVLVGGTGLYLKALLYGLSLGGAEGNEEIRARLHTIAQESDGKYVLHRKLAEVDPVSAAKFHPNDIRRVVRALEVYEVTGKPISDQKPVQADRPFDILAMAIDIPRKVLYDRLEKRVGIMLEQGLLDEVSSLLENGVTEQMQSMQGIGYKELVPVIKGDMSLEQAERQIVLNTRHYAKRQSTWLKAESKIVWLKEEYDNRFDEAIRHTERFLKGKQTNENIG